ncbi:hypothetical protein EJB05_08099, partial [Eragrostis curvula]
MAFSSSFQDLLVPFLVLILPLYYYLVFFRSSKARTSELRLPTDWPLVGMIPSLIVNMHRFHDYMATVLAATGSSFEARGPPSVRFFCTCDPTNVRHMFVSSFANYPKGEEFASFFDVMGRQLLQRRRRVVAAPASQGAAHHERLAAARSHGAVLPRQGRDGFTFDMTAKPVFGVDAGLLSVDMPHMHVPDAMDAVMEVGFFRHTVPVPCWRLMKRLNIGPERKLAAAQLVLRRFVAEMLERRKGGGEQTRAPVDIASNYMNDLEYVDEVGKPREFLYATLINYMFAGRDTVGTTLSWLFYNLIKHPRVAAAIRGELAPIAARKAKASTGVVVFEPEETKPLVYLQAALFESMRLYPPGPIERKARLSPTTSCRAVTRMEGVWGKDCAEYRPERWLTEDGALRHVPAHKFLPFNAGPRSCLGKDISVVQMMCVVAATVWNFDFVTLEGHAVEPKLSVVLQMKNGLLVKAKEPGGGE